MQPRDIARGLAWFGIGLGLAEVLAPRAMARAAGLRGREKLLRAFGFREIVAGALILTARNPQALLWTRVAGDILDGLLLSEAMRADNPERRRGMLATAAVAPVVALDIRYASGARGSDAGHTLPA